VRAQFLLVATVAIILSGLLTFFMHGYVVLFALVVALTAIGLGDMMQTRHAIRRNFPVIGHFRYLFEAIRPEIQQYFVESDTDGVPLNREARSIVYQRAKRALDTLPFGTRKDVYQVGYEWVNHSLAPTHLPPDELRVVVGGAQCKQPYSSSILNISSMSYGSLSKNAILALNAGAKLGNFSHDTGEGGLTKYHLDPGGDIVWEIGTAYFGCRTPDGKFDAERFTRKAILPSVKMIAIKLSQGAKPSHGGILPAAKVTEEISEIRGVPMGHDVVSPPAHTAFSTPLGLLEFVQQLRDLSGGKPVGFKLCVGKRREFISICKAMLKTGILPDFITVDGGEGGTGAAPLEFSNSVGAPLTEGLIFVHNCLVGFDLRKDIRIMCSGKIVTAFDIVSKIAIGADICNSARAMMLSLGCIQALRCNSNKCPTGVATQDPGLVKGLDVSDKKVRVASYHKETLRAVAEIVGAMGVSSTQNLRPWHINKRTGLAEAKHYGQLYDFLRTGQLLNPPLPESFARAFVAAQADSFAAVENSL
jgi:glutamate synthase domain-containing protein 2